MNGHGAGWSSHAGGGFGPLWRGLELGGGRGGSGVIAGELGAGGERVVRVVGIV